MAQSTADDAEGIVDTRPLSSRVLGGGNAEPGAYPSLVALVKKPIVIPNIAPLPLEDRLFCGGTVVAETWVLTAAHCVYDVFDQPLLSDSVNVVGSIRDLAQDEATEISVVRVIIHPDYDQAASLPPNDIALLELEAPIAAPPVTLFSGDTDERINSIGIIAGWGAVDNTDEFNPIYPTILQDAVVPLVSDEVCNGPLSYGGYIDKSHLCAGYAEGGVDACSGDSGGPLYLMIDGVQTQVAITSFGIGCGLPDYYGIYTDISYFIAWLGQYIPVPYQSPELLAKRAGEDNPYYTGGGSSDSSNSWLGSFEWLSLLVLTIAGLLRARSYIRKAGVV